MDITKATSKDLTQLGHMIEFEARYNEVKRGEIYFADLSDISLGNFFIPTKNRPVVIIQNDIGNKFAQTVIVALLTSSERKVYPMHYEFTLNNNYSKIIFETIFTIEKSRLTNKLGELTPKQMREAEDKLMYSLQLSRFNLSNLKDFEITNQTHVRTRNEQFISYNIEMYFMNNEKLEISIKLDKLKEFNNEIDKDMDFDELKKLLDNMRGLSWLVNNNDL